MRRLYKLLAVLSLSVAWAASTQATVIVYDEHATGSLQLAGASLGYDGDGNFEIGLCQDGDFNGPIGDPYECSPGDVRATSTHGTGAQMFRVRAFTAIEVVPIRTAEVLSEWYFYVDGADTTFEVNSFRELASFGWTLKDITAGSVVASEVSVGPSPFATGSIISGSLLSGHYYRMNANVATRGTSDEQASIEFSVGDSVLFDPTAVPAPGPLALMALGLLLAILSRRDAIGLRVSGMRRSR